MKQVMTGTIGAAAAAMLVMVASAQPTAQTTAPTTPQTTSPTAGTTTRAGQQDQEVVITGCVQRETDYRRAQDAGRGGVAGTGVGAGNEFVLTNASMSTGGATGTTAGATGAGTTAATGTAGTAAGAAYELTGSGEGDAAKFVGQRVEISGKLKPAEVGAGGATGGPTAGAPPRGVDVTSKDLKLRELEVTSIRAATGGGTCPPAP